MNKIQQKERRKFIRLKAYHLAKYRLLSTKETHPKFILAGIKDIGAGGICLRAKEAIPISSLIEVEIKFPALATPIFTIAKVVWAKKISRHKIYEVGAQFVEIEESTRRVIDERVKFVHEKTKAESKSFWEKLFSQKGIFILAIFFPLAAMAQEFPAAPNLRDDVMFLTMNRVQNTQKREEVMRSALQESRLEQESMPKLGEVVGQTLQDIKKHSHPYVTLGTAYDSNIDNTYHDAKGDMIYRGIVGIKNNFTWKDKAINFDTHLNGEYYGEKTAYNNLDVVTGFSGYMNIGKYILSMAESYKNNYIIGTRELGVKRSSGEVPSVAGVSGAASLQRRWENTNQLTFGRQFNRTGFDLGYTRIDTDYEPDSSENDKFENTYKLNSYLRVAKKTRILFGYVHDRIEYNKILSIENSDEYNLALTGALSAKLTYLLRGDYKETDNKIYFDLRDYTYTGNLAYAFSNRTNLSLNYNYAIEESANEPGYFYENILELKGNHKLAFNPKFNLSFSCSADLKNYPKNLPQGHDETYSYGFGLSYAFRQWIDFSLNWQNYVTKTGLGTDTNKGGYEEDVVEFKTQARF